jgi:phosphatidylglycerophosphate synthase
MWFTWANLLTGIRLASAIPCAVAVIAADWLWAGLIFVAAVLTDLLDGPVARRYKQASPLGGLFDHASDAAFVIVVLGALAHQNYLPWLLPGLVMIAFVQYTLDSKALQHRLLRSSALGRFNGIAYFVVVGTAVIRNALELAWPADFWIAVMAWLLVITSVVSIFDRARTWFLTTRT